MANGNLPLVREGEGPDIRFFEFAPKLTGLSVLVKMGQQ